MELLRKLSGRRPTLRGTRYHQRSILAILKLETKAAVENWFWLNLIQVLDTAAESFLLGGQKSA